MKQHLEHRIVAALKDDNFPVGNLGALLDETHSAIGQAEVDAKIERERALDPLSSPDPQQARAVMEDAAFQCERLRALLPRLEARYQRVVAAEERNCWVQKHDALKVKRDALATELSTTYPKLTAKLADLFSRVATNDAELSALHEVRPSGVPLHLTCAELAARHIDGFSLANPSIASQLRLPDWEESSRMIWPQPQTPFGLVATAAVAGAQRHVARNAGPTWFEGRKRRAEAHRAERERVAAYYERLHRECEDRENCKCGR